MSLVVSYGVMYVRGGLRSHYPLLVFVMLVGDCVRAIPLSFTIHIILVLICNASAMVCHIVF